MIPRSKRDRLTKNQIKMIDKPDLAIDSIGIAEVKTKKTKATLFVEQKS